MDNTLHTSPAFRPELANSAALSALHENVAILQRRYNNSKTVVAYLPDEMWTKIFRHTGRLFPDNDHAGFAYAQVCFRWRCVAFADPALWKNISSDYPKWILPSLTRSKSLPLHVNIGIDYGNSVKESTVFTILDQLKRIQSLSISVPDTSPINKFITYITSNIESAPLTTTIQFSVLTRIHVAVLPPDFFRGRFDRIHTLRLDNCAPNWDSCISRKLTTLAVTLPTFIRGPADQKAHITSLLELLSKAPVLEKLTLVNCMISVYREDWWDMEFPAQGDQEWPILELQALTHFVVAEEILSACSFLEQLRLPSVVSFSMSCLSDIEDVPLNIPSLFMALKTALPAQFGRNMETLKLEGFGTSSLRVASYCEEQACFEGSPKLTLRLTWSPWGEDRVPQFLAALANGGFLATIRSLHIITLQSMSSMEWISLLEALPRVESMYIGGNGLQNFLEALIAGGRDDNSTADEDTNAPLLLPALHSLHADHCDILNVAEFASLLRQRSDEKHGLEVLEVTRCSGFDESSATDMRMLVSELVWDGLDGWEDDSEDGDVDVDGQEYYVDDFHSTDLDS